jgi:hypothetical protein
MTAAGRVGVGLGDERRRPGSPPAPVRIGEGDPCGWVAWLSGGP